MGPGLPPPTGRQGEGPGKEEASGGRRGRKKGRKKGEEEGGGRRRRKKAEEEGGGRRGRRVEQGPLPGTAFTAALVPPELPGHTGSNAGRAQARAVSVAGASTGRWQEELAGTHLSP